MKLINKIFCCLRNYQIVFYLILGFSGSYFLRFSRKKNQTNFEIYKKFSKSLLSILFSYFGIFWGYARIRNFPTLPPVGSGGRGTTRTGSNAGTRNSQLSRLRPGLAQTGSKLAQTGPPPAYFPTQVSTMSPPGGNNFSGYSQNSQYIRPSGIPSRSDTYASGYPS
mgnify:CR=1 FL=1